MLIFIGVNVLHACLVMGDLSIIVWYLLLWRMIRICLFIFNFCFETDLAFSKHVLSKEAFFFVQLVKEIKLKTWNWGFYFIKRSLNFIFNSKSCLSLWRLAGFDYTKHRQMSQLPWRHQRSLWPCSSVNTSIQRSCQTSNGGACNTYEQGHSWLYTAILAGRHSRNL